jgi:large subunit ribosomal protein L25
MATVLDLQTQARQPGRKGPSRRLRVAGNIPAVVYGHGESQPISFSLHDFEGLMSKSPDGIRTLLRLQGLKEGDPETVIIKKLDRDPVTERIVHADFYRIRMDEEVEVAIPVHLSGTPRGVKEGGTLNHALHAITVRCLPTDTPHDIPVDISNLGMNESITVGDLPKNEKVTFLAEAGEVIVAVNPPRGTTGDEEGEGGAEPEVIGKGKADEDKDA